MTDMKYEFIRSGPVTEPFGTPYISRQLGHCSILPLLFSVPMKLPSLTALFGASEAVVLSYSLHSFGHRGNMDFTTGHK